MPTACRSCGRALMTGAERKVGRCSDCPPTYDEATFEALRAWRLETPSAAKVPAYVVFTDATLTAIAETPAGRASRSWPASPASAPPSSSGTASTCWPCWARPATGRTRLQAARRITIGRRENDRPENALCPR